MSKESFQKYKESKESGLKDVKFNPSQFGLYTFFTLLTGSGVGLIISLNLIEVIVGIIFVILGLYGMSYNLAQSREVE